jgi:hypothetical protein
MEANSELSSLRDGGFEEIAHPMRKDVMVVGGCRAARTDEGRQAGARGGALHVNVNVRPEGIQLSQPFEEIRLLRAAAGEPLVQMMVAVD